MIAPARLPVALAVALALTCFSCGRCGGETKSAPRGAPPKAAKPAPAPPPAAPPPPPAAPAAPPPTKAELAAEQARTAAVAMVDRWKAAQNNGDRETYFAQYEPKEFRGLKRTHDGKVTRFDFNGWKKDRGAMFARTFEVAVDELHVESWLEPGSTLRSGIIAVQFVQRWRSENYADHGPKSMLLWQHPKTGEVRIVFEELLLSRPGWDDASVAAETKFPALALAANVAEMTAALRDPGITMSTAKDAASQPEDSFHRGLLLEAAVGLGPLTCIDEITYSECGEDRQDWGKVENATIEHACVRRAIIKALLEQPLPAVEAVAGPLTGVLSFSDRSVQDEELGAAILDAVKTLPEPRRLSFLSAALSNGHWDEPLAPQLALLSPESLYTLWDQTKNPAVLRPLPADAHAAKLAAIETDQKSLPNAIMLPVVRALALQQQRELLASLAAEDDCELAMAAAAALASLGDASRLPSWEHSTDAETARRAICMLRFDPDQARADAELRRFFHPTRATRRVSLSVVDNELASPDEAGAKHEPTKQERAQLAEAAKLLKAPDNHGQQTGSVETVETPSPALLRDSRAFGVRDESDYDVVELIVEDGHVYVDYVGTYRYEWIGCPC